MITTTLYPTFLMACCACCRQARSQSCVASALCWPVPATRHQTLPVYLLPARIILYFYDVR